MADNVTNTPSAPRYLEPPTVTALREEARLTPPGPTPMIRTISEDIKEEREDLKEAAEQSLNIILDLSLDGQINWVSPSWMEVIGTPVQEVEGKFIRDIIVDNKLVFESAVESMKQDDSRSQIVRFTLRLGPSSVFWSEEKTVLAEKGDKSDLEGTELAADVQEHEDENIISLEGQGIMVYEKPSSDVGHVSTNSDPSFPS